MVWLLSWKMKKQECENCKALRELDNNNGWSEWRMPFSRLIVESHSTWNEELAMAMAIYLLGFHTYKGFMNESEEWSDVDESKMIKRIYEYAKHDK